MHKNKSFLRILLYVFKNYKIKIIIVTICIVISAIASTIASTFLQKLIDECILPGIDIGFFQIQNKLKKYISIMAIIYFSGVFASFLYNRLMADVTQGTLMKLRNDMFSNMESLPIRYFDTHLNGDIMSTYTNDVDSIRQLISQAIPTTFMSSLTILAIFIVMMSYSIWLTILVFLIILLMSRITKKIAGKSGKFMKEQQKSLANVEGFIEEIMEGQKVVKVFNHENEVKKEFRIKNNKLFDDGNNANIQGNILMPILGNIGNLMYVLVALFGGLLVVFNFKNLTLTGFHKITIGAIISFLGMSRHLSQTIGQISMQVATITMALASCMRVFSLIDESKEEDNGYITLVNVKKEKDGNLIETNEKTNLWAWKDFDKENNKISLIELKGDVRFFNVNFSYDGKKQILFDLSLYAKPGQKVAFVGATGAGKTTITNLINRFYDIPDGKIVYDGININKIKKYDLRKSLGIVLQDVNLFTGTVIENIRYGKLDATDEECKNAAKLANADDFINRLPYGYNTVLTNNGSELSQGQRQLISIARCAVANPPVMILDEATSSIDTRTEKIVQIGMDNLMKNRTVFVIAHRLSTVRNSDVIIVLDHGKIVEKGNHEELIAKKSIYYQLYTGAFELE